MKSEIEFRSDMDVELLDHMGSDYTIAGAAWVSNYGAQEETDIKRVPGLINFLMRDRHGTPFEHNSITFRISAPLFVFYEFHRHRVGWSYNEESARYRELDPVFYVPRADRALRQVGSPGKYEFTPGSEDQQLVTGTTHKYVARETWAMYQFMLEDGVAREVARNVLPVSIYKTMYATTNMRALMSFLSLRMNHPQETVPTFPLREIAMVAEKLDELVRPLFPLTMEAFDRNGRVGP